MGLYTTESQTAGKTAQTTAVRIAWSRGRSVTAFLHTSNELLTLKFQFLLSLFQFSLLLLQLLLSLRNGIKLLHSRGRSSQESTGAETTQTAGGRSEFGRRRQTRSGVATARQVENGHVESRRVERVSAKEVLHPTESKGVATVGRRGEPVGVWQSERAERAAAGIGCCVMRDGDAATRGFVGGKRMRLRERQSTDI